MAQTSMLCPFKESYCDTQCQLYNNYRRSCAIADINDNVKTLKEQNATNFVALVKKIDEMNENLKSINYDLYNKCLVSNLYSSAGTSASIILSNCANIFNSEIFAFANISFSSSERFSVFSENSISPSRTATSRNSL